MLKNQKAISLFHSSRFAAGTAAMPSISFISDPNTGVYSAGADQLGIALGGAAKLLYSAGAFAFQESTTISSPAALALTWAGNNDLTFNAPSGRGVTIETVADTLVSLTMQRNKPAGSYNVAHQLYIAANSKNLNFYNGDHDYLSITSAATAVATWTNVTHTGLNITSGQVLQVAGVQVVGARVVDARIDDTIAGAGAYDDTTAGVIDAMRDAMLAHGMMAAA